MNFTQSVNYSMNISLNWNKIINGNGSIQISLAKAHIFDNVNMANKLECKDVNVYINQFGKLGLGLNFAVL